MTTILTGADLVGLQTKTGDSPERPVFECGTCRGKTPVGDRHSCQDHLTPAAWEALQARRAEARRASRNGKPLVDSCPGCGLEPFVTHKCNGGMPPASPRSEAERIAAQLRAAGYKVEQGPSVVPMPEFGDGPKVATVVNDCSAPVVLVELGERLAGHGRQGDRARVTAEVAASLESHKLVVVVWDGEQ